MSCCMNSRFDMGPISDPQIVNISEIKVSKHVNRQVMSLHHRAWSRLMWYYGPLQGRFRSIFGGEPAGKFHYFWY